MKGANISLWLVWSSIAWLCHLIFYLSSSILTGAVLDLFPSLLRCRPFNVLLAHLLFQVLFLKAITHRRPSFPHFTSFPWANLFLDYFCFPKYVVLLTQLHFTENLAHQWQGMIDSFAVLIVSQRLYGWHSSVEDNFVLRPLFYYLQNCYIHIIHGQSGYFLDWFRNPQPYTLCIYVRDFLDWVYLNGLNVFNNF